jgi:hypothetical protein
MKGGFMSKAGVVLQEVTKAYKLLNEATYAGEEGESKLFEEALNIASLKKKSDLEMQVELVHVIEALPAERDDDVPQYVGELYMKYKDDVDAFEKANTPVVEKGGEEEKVVKKKAPTKSTTKGKEEKVPDEVKQKKAVSKEGARIQSKEVATLSNKVMGKVSDVTGLTFENCPEDYDALKGEAKKLALSSANSFVLLGQRLSKIREGNLYKADGYKDFKSFIQGEVKISRSTAYNYIDLIDCFGVQTFVQEDAPDASKLIPALPLMKADDEKISKADKKTLKARLIKDATTKTDKEMKEDLGALKVKYGLAEEKQEIDKIEATFDRLMSLFPETLTAVDKKKIQKFIKKLSSLVEG